MAETVRKTPESAESRFGEALASRDEAVASLGAARGLGPPDLCWVQKSVRGILRRRNGDARGYYHWVLGLDVGSSASVAAYFASMAAGVEKGSFLQGLISTRDCSVERGIYCCYDPFSQLDVWCDMCVPGGVAARAVNSAGQLFDVTPEIWKRLHVACFLRSQLYDAATVSSSKAVRHLDPFPTAREESTVLEMLMGLYREGTLAGCLERLHWDRSKGVTAEDADIVAVTVMHYFGKTQRWQQALDFFTRLKHYHPLAAIYIAAVQKKMGDSDAASTTLEAAQGTCSGSDETALTVALGWDRLRRGDVALAEEMAKRALEDDTLVRPAWTLLINCLVQKKEYTAALTALNSMPPPIMDASRKELLFHVIPPTPKGITKPLQPQYHPEIAEFRQISYESRAPATLIQSLPAEVIVPWEPENSAAAPEVAPSHATRAIVRSSFNLLFQIVEGVGWEEFMKVRADIFLVPAPPEDAEGDAEESVTTSGLLRSTSASEIQRILFKEAFVKLDPEPQQKSFTKRISEQLGELVQPITSHLVPKEGGAANQPTNSSAEAGAPSAVPAPSTAATAMDEGTGAVPAGANTEGTANVAEPTAPAATESEEMVQDGQKEAVREATSEVSKAAVGGRGVLGGGHPLKVGEVDGKGGEDGSDGVQEPMTPQGLSGEASRCLEREDERLSVERSANSVPEPGTPRRGDEMGASRDSRSDAGGDVDEDDGLTPETPSSDSKGDEAGSAGVARGGLGVEHSAGAAVDSVPGPQVVQGTAEGGIRDTLIENSSEVDASAHSAGGCATPENAGCGTQVQVGEQGHLPNGEECGNLHMDAMPSSTGSGVPHEGEAQRSDALGASSRFAHPSVQAKESATTWNNESMKLEIRARVKGRRPQDFADDEAGNEADAEDDDDRSCDWSSSPRGRPGHVSELAVESSRDSQDQATGFRRPPRHPVAPGEAPAAPIFKVREWKAGKDRPKDPASITKARVQEVQHIVPHNLKDRVKFFQSLVEEKEMAKVTQPWTVEGRVTRQGSMPMAEFLTLGWAYQSETEASLGNLSPRTSVMDSEDGEPAELEEGTVEGTVSRLIVKRGWHSMDINEWKGPGDGPGHRPAQSVGIPPAGGKGAAGSDPLDGPPLSAGPSAKVEVPDAVPDAAPDGVAEAQGEPHASDEASKHDKTDKSECAAWLDELILALWDDLATYSTLAHFDKKLKSELGMGMAGQILGAEEQLPEPEWKPPLGELTCDSPREAEEGESWGIPTTNQRDWVRRALLCQRLQRHAEAEQAFRVCLARGFNLTALLALSKTYAEQGHCRKALHMLDQVAHFHNGRHEFARDPYTPHSFVHPVGKLVRLLGPEEVKEVAGKCHPLVQHAVEQVLRCQAWGVGGRGSRGG